MIRRIRTFIETRILSLAGLAVLTFYMSYWLLRDSPKMDTLDHTIILFGVGLFASDCIPSRLLNRLSKFRYTLHRYYPKNFIVPLAILTVVGLYLRLNDLGVLSFYWSDEAITTSVAVGWLKYGQPILPSGVPYSRSLLNTYLISQSLGLFGINEFSARLISVVFGVATIPLIYLMGKEFGNKNIGLLAAIIVTFSFFEIYWSQVARMYMQFQFLYLLTVYLFFIGLKREDNRFLLASSAVFGLSLLSHVQASIFLVVLGLYIFIITKFWKNKKFILSFMIFILVFLVCLNFEKSFSAIISSPNLTLVTQDLTIPEWADKPFYFYIIRSDILPTLLFLVVISSIISIISRKFENERRKTDLFLLLNFIIPFIILSFYSWKQPRYALFIFPFLIIMASKAIDAYLIKNSFNLSLCEKISKSFKVKKESVVSIRKLLLVSIAILLITQVSLDFYYNFTKVNSWGYSEAKYREAGEFVKNHLTEGDKIMTDSSIISWFYTGQVDYLIRNSKSNQWESNVTNFTIYYDEYTGAIILDNYNLFSQEIKKNRGWVIIGEKSMDPKIRMYISNNMTFHPEANSGLIEVYSWNFSN